MAIIQLMFLRKPAPTLSMVHRSNILIALNAGKHWLSLFIYFHKRESKRAQYFVNADNI